MIPTSMLEPTWARISLVEIGSLPGIMRGPMDPPSSTMVSPGACSRLASTLASSGAPTPANTTWSSRSRRPPAMVISSSGEFMGDHRRSHRGPTPRSLRASLRGCSCRHQLARAATLLEQRGGADQVEHAGEVARLVNVTAQVRLDALGPVGVDLLDVRLEVLEVRLVEPVALAR